MTSSSVRESISLNDDFDVVIVGAGLTGLTAAYSILKRRVGLRVLILEANGGRVLLEENSQAFYGSFHQEHLVNLANELDIRMEKGRDGKGLGFFTKDGPLRKKVSPLVSGQVYHFLKLLQALSTDPRYWSLENDENSKELAEMSMNRFLQKAVCFSQARLLCKSLLYACCGIDDLEKLSALWFILMLQGAGGFFTRLSTSLSDEERFFIKGGFESVVKTLNEKIIEEGGIIESSETVLEIENIGETIFVSRQSIKFKCDYAVIAVPPPTSTLIAMKLNLPRWFLESRKLYEPGRNLFFHVTYKESYWPSDSLNCLITTADSDTSLRITYDATHPSDRKIRTLAGFASKTTDDSTPRGSLFGALRKCFGTQKSTRYISYSVGDWTLGDAGSPMSVLRPSPIEYHGNPMHLTLERIFFAASEYAKKWPGTVDGAIEAGETAASSILFRARPQALDRDQTRRYSDFRRKTVADRPPGIIRAHLICLGLNVCLFFFLLRDAYEEA